MAQQEAGGLDAILDIVEGIVCVCERGREREREGEGKYI